MATVRWKGNALAVAQVSTIAISGTWATSDTATITINGKDLVLTVGTDTTAANIATAIKEMFNGDTQTGTGDHTFSQTGNNIPEFNEITATVSTTTITLTGDTAGKPFTVTVSESTAGSGAVGSPSTTTAATGPNHFDNADNWSGGAVPVDHDDIVIDQGSNSIKYGLSQSAVTPASIKVTDGFTGDIGLPEVNSDGASTYFEYRDQYLALGNSGDATTTAVNIGGGEGTGSGRIKLDTGSGQVTVNVRNTGARSETAVPPLLWKGTHASNEFNVTKGDVGIAFFDGETATVATLRVGYQENEAGDSTVELNDGCTLTNIEQTGGTLTFRDNVSQFDQRGGESFVEGAAAITTLNLDEGECRYKSTGTLATVLVGSGGVLDFRQDQRTRVVTTCDLYEGSEYHDPFDTVEDGSSNRGPASLTLRRTNLDGVVLNLPENISMTLNAAVSPSGADHGGLSGLSDDDHTQYLLVAGTRAGTGNQELLALNFTDVTELTISSGAVTKTQTFHSIDTESDAASDDLDTISGGANGDMLVLIAANASRTVTLKHGTGNIVSSSDADVALTDNGHAVLFHDGTNWRINAASAGGGISNVVEDTTPQLGGDLDANSFDIQFDDATGIRDDSDNEQLIFQKTASAVNHVELTNAATGNNPLLAAVGDDTNIGLDVNAKGTGNISLGNFTFDADQSVGAGQDNYVLTYDHSGGVINLEAAAAGSAALPQGYISGLTLSNNGTDAEHDIDIATGVARDAADASDLELSSAITKRIDASWASGTGNGGLSSSLTLSADTWYHVHLITVSGSDDVGFDTSITAANLVTDHSATAYRRIGSVRTDGSANIIAFIQNGDEFYWSSPTLDISATNPGTSAVLRTLRVPTGVTVCAIYNLQLASTTASMLHVSWPSTTDVAPSFSAAPLGATAGNSSKNGHHQLQTLTNTSSQIRTRVSFSDANTDLDIVTLGWRDFL